MKHSSHALTLLASGTLALASIQIGCASQALEPDTPPMSQDPPPASDQPQTAHQSPEELDQLVAPIALYPDALVAQILAAATYPTQVVEAQRWMQQHTGLKGQELAQAADPQPWDPSVKALTQFSSVLALMDKNLSWTSSLGNAYADDQQGVLDAVQEMRKRAEQAGTLKSTSQETVSNQGQTIVIEPADPEVVYVPEYDPWVVYGEPVAFYPGWAPVPGYFVGGPGIAFGLGVGIGFFGGFGWGWHHWGADWHHHHVMYDHNNYVSHSTTIINHNTIVNNRNTNINNRGSTFNHGGAAGTHNNFNHFGGGQPNGGQSVNHFNGGQPINHFSGGQPINHFGGATSQPSPGIRSGAFSGFNHGGVAGAYSSRGSASFGGGLHTAGAAPGGFHGGPAGGGFHGAAGGGGGHGGGGGGHR